MSVKPIPDGYHTITPYIMLPDPGKLIDFVKGAFDGQETERIPGPDGVIMHAEVRIGDSVIMMGSSGEQMGPRPGTLYVYVDDADATYRRTLDLGATSIMEPGDQPYGDRLGGVVDPLGNQWWIATHFEDVTPEEIMRRMQEKR